MGRFIWAVAACVSYVVVIRQWPGLASRLKQQAAGQAFSVSSWAVGASVWPLRAA